MNYQEKYLKYQDKYLHLLELTGGAAAAPDVPHTTNPTDVLNPDGVVKCVCGEVFVNPEFGAPRSTIFTLACDYKVDPCHKCGKHICIYCGDEVAKIPGRSNGEYSAHNIPGKEPTIGSHDAHFGWAPYHERPYKKGSWPRNSGWCLKRPDVLFRKSDRGRKEPITNLRYDKKPLYMSDLKKALKLSLQQEKERQREKQKKQQRDHDYARKLSLQKECQKCTFLNQTKAKHCEICGNRI